MPIMLLLEFDWVKDKYKSPLEETATIMLILGLITFWGIE
jgi:hypothetical protein